MQCKYTSLAKTGNLTRGVAVEGKLVESSAGETSDLVLVGQSNDAGTESSGGLIALEGEEVGSETGNVGGSHGGSRDGVLIYLLAFWYGRKMRARLTVPPANQVERMETPGANTSTRAP